MQFAGSGADANANVPIPEPSSPLMLIVGTLAIYSR